MNTLKLGNFIIGSVSGVSKPNGNPSSATATPLTSTTLKIDWTNGATNQDGTYIYTSLDNSTWSLVETALGNLETKNITISKNIEYYVKVVHYKGSKLSDYSNTASNIYTINYIGAIDYQPAIEEAFNTHYIVHVGLEPLDTFWLGKAVYLKDDSTIKVNSILKVTNSEQQILQANVSIGSYTVTVQDGSKYKVGDYVAVSDDLQPAVGGGAGQTRKMSLARKVTGINSNILSFAEASDVAFSTTSNGTVGTCNSAIICYDVESVVIKGTGTIDGNKANQYNHGFWKVGGMEEIYASNGIAVRDCSNITFKDITVTSCNLHDITTWNTSYVDADSIHLFAADNKNWLFYQTSHFTVDDSSSDDAEYEDGFVLYYGNTYGTITNCSSENNGRMGLGINSTNHDIIVNNFSATDNGQNLYIGLSYNCTINTFYSNGGGVIKHNTTTPYRPVDISVSHDIEINNLYIDGSELACNELIAFRGNTYNIDINGGFAKNTLSNTGNGFGYQLIISDGDIPYAITINDFQLHSLKNAMGNYNDTTDRLILNRVDFATNTAFGVLRDSTKYYDCTGIIIKQSGQLTYTAAQTQKYVIIGIPYIGATFRPVATRFNLSFKDGDGGNATTIVCGWVATASGNNARIDLDQSPGKTIYVNWDYDHNRRP